MLPAGTSMIAGSSFTTTISSMRKLLSTWRTILLTLHEFLVGCLPVPGLERPLLAFSLVLTIPAFYLTLESGSAQTWLGHAIYLLAAMLVALDLFHVQEHTRQREHGHLHGLEVLILLGLASCAWPQSIPWSQVDWLWRLAVCGLVFIRLAALLGRYLLGGRLFQIVLAAIAACAVAGAGFLWLEPKIHSHADGVWLAFVTAATVGYGDLVPSTPASRILAVFIVLLGYALFSAVTASIAALLVGEDEKRLSREMHADLRQLRREIAMLREQLLQHAISQAVPPSPESVSESIAR